jgi:hypothetical protein
VNCLSVEPSGLISVRVIAPHATSQEDKACGISDCGGRCEGRTLEIRRGSDSREEGLQPSLLVTGKTKTQSHSIVVSAPGWLVVNPLGVAKPTVGWKRAPLSAVA